MSIVSFVAGVAGTLAALYALERKKGPVAIYEFVVTTPIHIRITAPPSLGDAILSAAASVAPPTGSIAPPMPAEVTTSDSQAIRVGQKRTRNRLPAEPANAKPDQKHGSQSVGSGSNKASAASTAAVLTASAAKSTTEQNTEEKEPARKHRKLATRVLPTLLLSRAGVAHRKIKAPTPTPDTDTTESAETLDPDRPASDAIPTSRTP